jgi:hypothetical protein
MTLSITTFSQHNGTQHKGLISDIEHNDTQITKLCHYAEWHCAECCNLFLGMLNVIMLSVVLLNVIRLNVVMLSVVAPFLRLNKWYFSTQLLKLRIYASLKNWSKILNFWKILINWSMFAVDSLLSLLPIQNGALNFVLMAFVRNIWVLASFILTILFMLKVLEGNLQEQNLIKQRL